MTPARMRTLDAAIEQLLQDDPRSCLTRCALRRMVLQGRVPHIRAGSKYLVNYDGLLSVLSGELLPDEKEPTYGKIRAVK
jgi:hypothetical protein